MYFTSASPVSGRFAGHSSNPIPGRLARGSGALALLFVLACAAAPTRAAPADAPLLQEAEDEAKAERAANRAKTRKPAKRSKAGAAKVTVTPTAAPDKALPPAPAAGGDRWDIVVADRTLNAAMARWAAAAGWQLLWELPVDYAVQAHTSVPGRFEDAVTLVVNSMEGAEIPMKAVFYSGNKVLRIMAKGAQ